MGLGKVTCPQCSAKVELTSKVVDGVGERIQPIIKAHYGEGRVRCSGSEAPVGEVQVRSIKRKEKSQAA